MLLFKIILLFSVFTAFANPVIENRTRVPYILELTYGHKNILVDTIKPGIYKLDYFEGFYKITKNDSIYQNFFYSKTDTNLSILIDSNIKIINSIENQIYKDYFNINSKYSLIIKKLSRNNNEIKNDSINQIIDKSISYLISLKDHKIDSILKICKKCKMNKIINTNILISELNFNNYFNEYLFNDYIFTYSRLIQLFTYKYLMELAVYDNDYKISFDKLITYFENSSQQEYVIQYLLDITEESKLIELYNYIAENYIIQNNCNDFNINTNLIDKINYTKIGNFIDNDEINIENKKFLLKDYINKKTILFFFNPECTICKEAYIYLKNQSNVNYHVLFINTSKTITNNNNKELFRSRNSKFYEKFGINKTPTFIIINDNLEIIEKPETLYMLKKIIGP